MKTNDKKRYITIKGKEILVSEEVYSAYKRPAWAERQRKRRERRCRDADGGRCMKDCWLCDQKRMEGDLEPIERTGRPVSLEALGEDGFLVPDTFDMEELVAESIVLEELDAALEELKPDESALIKALYYEERSARSFAREIGLSHQAVNKREKKVLAKLKNLLKKYL